MSILKKIIFIIALLLPSLASAQFFVTGDDPGSLKWNSFDTESYRVIYPQGADSLAKVYGQKLEKYKIPVSRTSGYVAGEGDGKIMPVIIHAFNDSNGSVAWMPRRMDLYTIPNAYDPTPIPWSTMLTIHESRHVSQMQFGLTERHKNMKWILGEAWNGVAVALYPGSTNMEGDAVVIETALTPSGRGRTADFLNYYWVAFDQGDHRGWFKWRYVSQKRYSPTFYALGYMTIGGFRYLYDEPYFYSKGMHMVAKHPIKVRCLYDINKEITGHTWEETWQVISRSMYEKWKANAAQRGPYIPSERVLPESKRYTDYVDNLIIGDDIYTIKKGHVHAPTLIRVDSLGKEHRVSSFAYTASAPKWDAASNSFYWSETLPDKRWTLKSSSKIRYMKGERGAKKSIRNKDMLFNPSRGESMTAAVRYHNDGRTSIEILHNDNGEKIESFNAPDSLQLVETALMDGLAYATAISDNGYGIYRLEPEGAWTCVLGPQPVMMKDFDSRGSELLFTSDRTGSCELYHLDISTGDLYQKTSTRYGGEGYQYSNDGKWLYYSSQTLMGKHLFRTPVDSLFNRKVRFDSLYKYPIAEKLKEQELAAARAQGFEKAVTMKEEDVWMSEPKRYHKVPNMLHMHTWFPVYASVDNIMNNLSFDPLWQSLSLGATGILQNRLSTAVGEFGYSAHKDPYNPAKWRHSGHVKFTYSGLYPIFQFSFDINDRGARQYWKYADAESGQTYMVSNRELSSPYIQGKVNMYIPFSFSSGGWYRGVIPRLSYTISNDIFNTGTVLTEQQPENSYVGYIGGKKKIMQSVSTSLRGYTMLPVANSQVYPRWGIGVEAGLLSGIENYDVFSPMGYVYGYGYVPGVIRTQGIKFSAMWQRKLRDESPFSRQIVDILPRGLSNNSALGSHISLYNRNIMKVTADYAIPIYIGDITVCRNWLAIKRLVTYPHFDYSFIGKKGLWSAGLDLTADLHAIITIEVPCSFGLSFSWNGGSAWEDLTARNISMNKWFLGPIFNVTF